MYRLSFWQHIYLFSFLILNFLKKCLLYSLSCYNSSKMPSPFSHNFKFFLSPTPPKKNKDKHTQKMGENPFCTGHYYIMGKIMSQVNIKCYQIKPPNQEKLLFFFCVSWSKRSHSPISKHCSLLSPLLVTLYNLAVWPYYGIHHKLIQSSIEILSRCLARWFTTYWLAFIVQESAIHSTEGEKQSSISLIYKPCKAQ